MKDFVSLGTGSARYLKSIQNFLAIYPTYEDFATALAEGTLPFDFNGYNRDGVVQFGDPLYSGTLLSDETAEALFETEVGDDETPDSAFYHIAERLASLDGSVSSIDDSLADLIASVGTITTDIATIHETLATKADMDGTYDDLTAGMAKQLDTTAGLVTTEPYSYRAIPSGAGGWEKLQSIQGMTVAWNQLIRNGNFADGTSGFSATNGIIAASNHELTYTVQTAGTTYVYGFRSTYQLPILTGHKLLLTIDLKSSNPNLEFRADIHNKVITLGKLSETYKTFSAIASPDNANSRSAYFYTLGGSAVGDMVYATNLMLIDLTQLFGTTIADAIYALETATPGAGVAWFRSYFPADYYAYNAGELMSVQTSGHITKDADDEILRTYPLDPIVLRGIPKLVDGKLSADGDEYQPDGSVTRRFGIVDLGTLNWTYYNVQQIPFFYADIIGAKEYPVNGLTANAICGTYPIERTSLSGSAFAALGYGRAAFNGYDVGTNDRARLMISDSAYTTAATFKAAMSGVYLVYELATPTTETAEPYSEAQTIDQNGTESFADYAVEQGTRDVAIPVGNETFFPTDVASKLSEILTTPTTDGNYRLRCTVSGGIASFSWVAE